MRYTLKAFANASPAGPPPTITTSYSSVVFSDVVAYVLLSKGLETLPLRTDRYVLDSASCIA